MTFEQAVLMFQLTSAKEQRLPRTVENYVQVVRYFHEHVVNLLGDPDVVQERLQAWVDEQDKLYLKNKTSASRIRTYISALRAFFSALDAAQVTATLQTSARKPETEPRPLERSQLDALFKALDLSTPDGLRDAAMIWLYYNGLRNTEVATLKTNEVQYSSQSRSLVLRIRGKGDKFRLVVQHPIGATVLAAHLLRTQAPNDWEGMVSEFGAKAEAGDDPARPLFLASHHVLTKVLPKDGPFVFPASDGKPLSRRWSNKMFARYRESAGLGSDVGPHSLRHTFATELLESDAVDLITLQKLLGHASLRQTAGYAEVLEGKKARAMHQLYTPNGSTATEALTTWS